MHSLSRVSFTALFIVFFSAINIAFSQQPFAPGNIVVVRVGDGVTPLAGSSTTAATFLDEYNALGVRIQSIALPTTTSGANKPLTLSGTATSEGYITRSADGTSLAVSGYNAIPGTSGVNAATSASVNRGVALINNAGTINSSTALTDAADGNNIRGAVTNGTGVWVTGGAGGIRYATIGSSTSTQLSTTLVNLRAVSIVNGQIYVSSSSGSVIRLATVGTGQPTTAGQTIANLPNYNVTNSSPHQFFMADLTGAVAGPDVIYVADDNGTAGGIQKYSLVGGNWTLNNTIGSGTDEYRGITGVVTGNSVTIYAIRKGGSTITGGGELVSLTDNNGYNAANNGTVQLLASAGTSQAFRGVALAPTLTALPLQLISFNSSYSSGIVLNEWITQNENKVDRIELQRSGDGVSFLTLATITVLNKAGNYKFADPSPLQGKAYYRLKMIDLDGQFTFSKVNGVQTKTILHVSPNPARSLIQIDHARVAVSGKISIVNALGMTVKEIILAKTATRSDVDVSGLAAGSYIIRSSIDGVSKTVKFEKK